MIVCLIGRSGSGKSTVAEQLTRCGFSKLNSWTSRERRPGDERETGIIFSTKEEMQSLYEKGFFLEMKEYQGNLYGTENIDINTDKNYVKTIEKQGYIEIKEQMRHMNGPAVISIYLDISRETSIDRCSSRQGGLSEYITNRVEKDDRIYGESNLDCYDCIINAEKSLAEVMEDIKNILKYIK